MPHPRPPAHDIRRLLARWDQLARRLSLASQVLGEAEGIPIIGLETASAAEGAPALYVSAGVHGDEAACPWALLEWMEENGESLKGRALMVAPCLNPVGLQNNTRVDHTGRDINRHFHSRSLPLMKQWRAWVKSRNTKLGACLHEDYDAEGCYIYELAPSKASLAEKLLGQCESVMPRDLRKDIDGQRAKAGIIRRATAPEGLAGPEAIVLSDLGCSHTLTFETGSEWDILVRIAAHKAFLAALPEAFP
jgi:hypothetical protein